MFGHAEVAYGARIYNRAQLEPHAAACREGKCRSCVHCFFGIPRSQANGPNPPNPVCAARIVEEIDRRSERKNDTRIEFATPDDAAACAEDLRNFGEYFVRNGKRVDPTTVTVIR